MHNAFRHQEWTLKRKLFGYMLLLAALPLLVLVVGLSLFGRLGITEKSMYESLDIQMEILEKDVSTHFDYLAAAGIQLSEDMTGILEQYLKRRQISFKDLEDSDEDLAALQDMMIEPLKQKLLQEDCSGVFVMLDATVNPALEDSSFSRSGLYLQFNGYEMSDKTLLLYRGLAETGKEHGVMPHRKWRQEFRTDHIPEYEEILSQASLPLEEAYRYTKLVTLPGTSEHAMLLVVPMVNKRGDFYGLCGFEISASYFMTYYAQPTKIDHLTCLVAPGDETVLHASEGLSCGVAGGYYRTPKGELEIRNAEKELFLFSGETGPYIGLKRPIALSPNNEDTYLTVMMLQKDYEQAVRKSLLQNVILWSLLLFFTVNCCLLFSRQFLTPILSSLDQIRRGQWDEAQSEIPEINDLFAYLAEKDREHEEVVSTLAQEKTEIQGERNRLASEFEAAQLERDRLVCEYEAAVEESKKVSRQLELAQERYEQAQRQYEEAQSQVQTAQTEISRLAYSRKIEIDPDDYERFLEGIQTLTPAERKIFDHYLAGRTVKEILEIASIKESTLRYHNQNIYSKLGVNSLKQLLRYAALMREDEKK